MIRPYPWLPQKTSQGEEPRCQNCEMYGRKNDDSPYGVCGHYDWLCGKWIEAKEQQLEIREARGDNDKR